MSPESTFKRFRESMLNHTEAWKDLLADEVTLTGPLAEASGKEQFISVNESFFASIRSGELHELVAHGDRVITRITTTVDAPGRVEIPLAISEWYTIREGRVTDLTVYFDTAALRQAMVSERPA